MTKVALTSNMKEFRKIALMKLEDYCNGTFSKTEADGFYKLATIVLETVRTQINYNNQMGLKEKIEFMDKNNGRIIEN